MAGQVVLREAWPFRHRRKVLAETTSKLTLHILLKLLERTCGVDH